MTRVIYNGRVYLGGGDFCGALLTGGGRILKTGPAEELLAEAPAGTEKIDAGGALILPAFHDSHLHLMGIGRRSEGLDGGGAASIEEVIRRGRELIEGQKIPPGTYIQGGGVNPDLFSAGEKRDLLREDLDRLSTAHPVIIGRHCGHTIFCNSLALKMAGLDRRAPEVEGGTVERDGTGRPTGVLRENAAALVRKPIPPLSRSGMKRFLALGMKKAHSLGIGAVGSYDTGGPDFETVLGLYREIYEESREASRPALRVTMQCGVSGREDLLEDYLRRGVLSGGALWEDPEWGTFLRMGPVKLFVDGTLGGQTAWMRRPYRDKPESSGFPVLDPETLRRLILKAAGGNMQVEVHAIGDAGLAAVLDAFEEITAPGRNPLRHGIIHCQISSPDLLERMGRNRILALVQPVFLADDMYVLESRVGPELAATSYAWGTMERLGVPVSYGTDAPVCSADPLLGIRWAVLRQDPQGAFPPGGFYPRERVDLHTAVEAYTAGSAYAAFAEDSLGRIAPGFLADLVFIDRDIFSLPPEELHRAKVLRTMIAGETVWEG
jgi:predicted amidohydrolase YtcJ